MNRERARLMGLLRPVENAVASGDNNPFSRGPREDQLEGLRDPRAETPVDHAERESALSEAIIRLDGQLRRVQEQLGELLVEGRRARIRRHVDASRWAQAQRAAAKRRKPWSISRAEYDELVAQPCHYCGDPTGSGIGLDRVDVSRGYEVDNVLPCCGPCNLTRGSRYTPEEMVVMMRALRPEARP